MEGIVAVDDEYGIGQDGQIPWHFPVDLKWFRGITWGKNILMGRNTFESMPPGPFEGREMHVLTHHPDTLPEYASLLDLDDIPKPAVVIGGSELYAMFMQEIDTFWVTRIPGVHNCDTFFPQDKFEPQFYLVSSTSCEVKTGDILSFQEYKQKP